LFQLTGNKAPPLKRLANWLSENPMFDVDPKWADLVKERGNLPQDLQKRLPQGERKKPGRPPMMASPTTTSQSATPTSQAMNFPGLAGLNPSLLNSMSANNPFLLPFSNMSALGNMGGFGNLGLSNSLFANLASLGLPSLAGLDANTLNELAAGAAAGAAAAASGSKGKAAASATSSSAKADGERRDRSAASTSSKSSATAAASAAASAASALPFLFPNPNLALYSQLGLAGLGPFYDSIAQQCGLLNGTLTSTAATSSSATSTARSSSVSNTTTSSSGRPTVTSASSVAANNRHQRTALERQQQQQLQQFLMPSDQRLLDSITGKNRASADDRGARRSRAEADNLRQLMAAGLAPGLTPGLAASLTPSLGGDSKRAREAEAELLARFPEEWGGKRSRDLLESLGQGGDARMREFLESMSRDKRSSSTKDAARTAAEEQAAKAREAVMKEAMDKLGHVPTDLIIRSAMPASTSSDERKRSTTKETLESLGQSLVSGALAGKNRDSLPPQVASLLSGTSLAAVSRSEERASKASKTPVELVVSHKSEKASEERTSKAPAAAQSEEAASEPPKEEHESAAASERLEDSKVSNGDGDGASSGKRSRDSERSSSGGSGDASVNNVPRDNVSAGASSEERPAKRAKESRDAPEEGSAAEAKSDEPSHEPKESEDDDALSQDGDSGRGRGGRRRASATSAGGTRKGKAPEDETVGRKVLRSSAGRAAAAAAARAARDHLASESEET